MAITVVPGNVAITQDQRALSWTIASLAVGDVVVIPVVTWDTANTMNNPAGTGLTFSTPQVDVSASGHTRVYIWAMAATSAGTSVVVTCSVLAATNSIHNGVLIQCPAADGYSLAGTPNTVATAAITPGTAGQANLTGTSGNLGIVALGDFNGISGASRAWLNSATEDMYQFSSTDTTQYASHCTLTGASTTVGLTAPTTSTAFTLGAIEVLASGGGPAAARTSLQGNRTAAIQRATNY